MQVIQILRRIPNKLEELLNFETCNIDQWFLSNKLTLNVDKTERMIIATRQRLAKVSKEINVSIDKKTLKQVYSKKILGVIIDDKLCWNE